MVITSRPGRVVSFFGLSDGALDQILLQLQKWSMWLQNNIVPIMTTKEQVESFIQKSFVTDRDFERGLSFLEPLVYAGDDGESMDVLINYFANRFNL